MFSLLIVEDEMLTRNGIATYFPWGQLGIEVVAACGDGEEALELVRGRDVDFLLCDIRMPRMDGLTFVEKVRALGKNCDIVLISAHKDFEYARRALELGVRHFIVKPAGYEALHGVFSRLVDELVTERGKRQEGMLPPSPMEEHFLRLVERTVDENLSQATLAATARSLEMSPNYFSTLFHKRSGVTFSAYLAQRRMDKAKELLETSGERVYRIASLVGYANPKSFMRAFRDRFGTSPQAMRKGRDGEA